jgi:acetyl esterase/lipase
MRLHATLTALAFAFAATPAVAQTAAVERQHVGNRVTENVPEIPAGLVERLNRYQNTRGAGVSGWTREGCLLIGTRFAETNQVHRVCQPMGMREQLTFHPEPVAGVVAAPPGAAREGFVYAKDTGGDEFSQLYWFDAQTRESTLLSDGKRSQNGGTVLSLDGARMAFSSTARNGTDRDIWVRDTLSGENRLLLSEGGSWTPLDFSPDGSKLLVMKYVSISESYPGEVDVATGALRMFPVEGGTAAFAGFAYARDGRGVYYISDEPVGGRPAEFLTLRFHDPRKERPEVLSAHIPWDVEGFTLSRDGRHLAYMTNEDGIGRVHLLSLPGHRPVPLPELPVGLVGGGEFSHDGRRLALTLNTATSPSDAYVIDLGSRSLERWTRSEVGGLDTGRFVEPTLVRYPTFDTVDGQPRTIPAFYYRPANVPPGRRLPVIISIHGGPESQSRPAFNPTTQFLVNELGVALLVPNVRGSSGYGKTYLSLDNAQLREDSVKDIGALLDWIATQPELDAGRVGVVGGSYGGYMVLASLMHYSDRIRAGINVVGISDFVTFLTNTESYRRDLRRAEYGDERDPEMRKVFDAISPLRNAHRIDAPLFVAHGRNDPRVPYTEAEQIVQAVRANGRPVWFLMFDDEGHGFRKKSNSDYFGAASVLFWQQHLLDGVAQ